VRTPTAARRELTGANGKVLLELGTVTLVFTIDGYAFRHTFRLVEGGFLLLLGNDFLAAHDAVITPRGNTCALPHPKAPGGWFEAGLAVSDEATDGVSRAGRRPSVKRRPSQLAAAVARAELMHDAAAPQEAVA
jgi:hypothetical protein